MRDLGGHPTRCGRQIRHNRLFRAGSLAHLEHADWQQLAELNIRVICDFRRDDERQREPTSVPGHIDIEVIALPIDPGSQGGLVKNSMQGARATTESAAETMLAINREFATAHTDSFRLFMQHVQALAPGDALLFHCTAGKDRTGFAAAILLAALNVERDLIEREYALTPLYYVPGEQLQAMQGRYPQVDWKQFESEALLPLLDARPDYIAAALDTVDSHWGSMENYIRDALGLKQEDLQQLQDLLLE